MSKSGAIVLSVVLTAVIAVSGTYVYMQNKADGEKTDLEAQVAALQSSATTTTSATTSATADETTDWETYANEKYGFSFKYPATWKVSDFPTDQETAQRMSVEPDNEVKGLGLETFSVNIADLSEQGKTFDEFIQENFQQLKDDKLNGINVKSGINPSIAEHTEYVIQSGNYAITIAAIIEEEASSAIDIETASLIAKTFEFTK